MKDVPVEAVQKHVVDIAGEAFPPKQVFATVTGRSRQSFTTYEAQRVLTKLGFVCRRARNLRDGTAAVPLNDEIRAEPTGADRIAFLEAAVGTMQAAIAGLHARLVKLEAT